MSEVRSEQDVQPAYTWQFRRALKAEYPKGCLPPGDYIGNGEWALAQQFHGLNQTQCSRCLLWHFPQQVEGHTCKPRKAK